MGRFDLMWYTGGDWARSTGNTWGIWVASDGVSAVEPEHVCGVIVPKGEGENHTLLESLGHRGESTMSVVDIWVSENGLLVLAEFVGERVTWEVEDGGLGVGDDPSILDVESLDLAQSSGVGASVGEELSDDSEDRVCVDSHTWAVERPVALAIRVEIASVRIGNASVSIGGVSPSTGLACASALCLWLGGVRSEGGGDGVGLPNIHLSAARTVASKTGVGVV